MKATIESSEMKYIIKTFEDNEPEEIVEQLEEIQDLGCLVRMNPVYGDGVSTLKSFLNK